MLKIEDLHVSYGGIRALRGISLEVPDGKIVTLIGANGAGKSTTLRTISGLVKAESGSITYDGKELLGMPINRILEQGTGKAVTYLAGYSGLLQNHGCGVPCAGRQGALGGAARHHAPGWRTLQL